MKDNMLSCLLLLVSFCLKGQALSFEKTFKVNFPNGQANTACYINFPKLIIGGEIEVDIAGYYNWQVDMGGMTKKIGLLAIPDGYFSQASTTDKAYGPLSAQWEIGDFDKKKFRIPIYHRASLGNELYIRVSGLVQNETTSAELANSINVTQAAVEVPSGNRNYNINVDHYGVNRTNPKYTLDVNGSIHSKEVQVD